MDAKVLLIHSDTQVQNEFVQAFAHAGVQLSSATGFEQAIDKIDHEKFEAIFFDTKTIGAYGNNLEHRIQKSAANSKVPVIVLRENEDRTVRASSGHSEETFLIYKPFDTPQLMGILASHIDISPLKRQTVRVSVNMHVQIDTHHEQFSALADSLSEGGMNLLVSGDVTLDTQWVVAFNLPDSDKLIEGSGRVRRTSEAHVALSFDKLHVEGREEIRKFVAARSRIS